MTSQEYSVALTNWPATYSDGQLLHDLERFYLEDQSDADYEATISARVATSGGSVNLYMKEQNYETRLRVLCCLLIGIMPREGISEALDSLNSIRDYYIDLNNSYITHSKIVASTGSIVSKSTRPGSVITE